MLAKSNVLKNIITSNSSYYSGVSNLLVTDNAPSDSIYYENVQDEESMYPIKMYVDGDTLKLYSEADIISFNTDSSYLFLSGFAGIHFNEINLNQFDFSKVEDATNMFCASTSKIIGIEDLDVSNLKVMDNMFVSVNNLENLDLSKWECLNLTSMKSPFSGSSIINLNMNNWDLKLYTDYMFSSMNNLSNLSLKNAIFYNNSKLNNMPYVKIIDITGADFSNVTIMNNYFSDNYNLEDIIGITNINVSNVNTIINIFGNDQKYKYVDLSGWNTSNVTNIVSAFVNSFMEELVLDNWIFNNRLVFYSGYVKKISLRNSVIKVYNNSCFLDGCRGLEEIDITGIDISAINSLSSFFFNLSKLNTIKGIETLDVSNITNFSASFCGCSSLKNVNLSSWNMSNALVLELMFSNSGIEDISSLSSWNTSKVGGTYAMFSGAKSLTDISALENWDTTSLVSVGSMFNGCTNLSNVSYLNNWVVHTTDSYNLSNIFNNTAVSVYPTWDGTWDSSTGSFIPNT